MRYLMKEIKYSILSILCWGNKKKYYQGKLKKYDLGYNLVNLEHQIINMEYEFADKFKLSSPDIKIPKILSIEETIDDIIMNKKSVCRFGDGEFVILLDKGKNNYYNQKRNLLLIQKLRDVLQSGENNTLICLWDYWGDLSDYNDYHKSVARMHLNDFRRDIYEYLDFNKVYGNAFISRPYIILSDRSKSEQYFQALKKIWDKRNVVIVEGSNSRLGVGNDLFDNVNSIERVLCPSEAAFDKYNEIFKYVSQNCSKDKLILIALGMTATVLAYDLAKCGFQAIDIGHVDIEYEWFLRKCDYPEPVRNKYVNEAGGKKAGRIQDSRYLESIIKEIK